MEDTTEPEYKRRIFNRKEDNKEITKIFNKARLWKAITESKNKKAPGPDMLYNEMIKHAKEIITKPLLDIFMACVKIGYTPKIWQTSGSAIIAKPGKPDYTNARAYRIITLTSNFLKLLETLILWYMKEDLKIEQTIQKNQFGFKKGSSTEAAVLKLIEKVQGSLRKQRHTIGCFLDIKGAFDNVPFKTIKQAMDKTQAKGMISDWIYNMVSNRKIIIECNGEKITKKINKGCPKGGVIF